MRAGVLRAADWSMAGTREVGRAQSVPFSENAPVADVGWDEETFAEEQIRGLVRHVFSSGLKPPVQQVVFSPVEQETDIRDLCSWVGEILAQGKSEDIAVIDETEIYPPESRASSERWNGNPHRFAPLRQLATRIHRNVWIFPPRAGRADHSARPSICAYMAELRREFEYSIVAAPAFSKSSQALEMARFADGIILVLSAQHTRRVSALKVRNALRDARLLGTVLSDREFPMPSSIYRRL